MYLTVAKAVQWAGRGRRGRRAHFGKHRRTTAERAPGYGNPTAPTAPGPKTACTCAASTTYWRWRQRREVEPTRGMPVARPAMGPRRIRKVWRSRRRGKKPCSVRSPRKATTESRMRQENPPNGRARLMRVVAKGGKEGGNPPHSSARPRCAAGAQGRPPNTAAKEPTARPGPGQRRGPPAPSARATRAWEGGGG